MKKKRTKTAAVDRAIIRAARRRLIPSDPDFDVQPASLTMPAFQPLTPAEFLKLATEPLPILLHPSPQARAILKRLLAAGLHGSSESEVCRRLLDEKLREHR